LKETTRQKLLQWEQQYLIDTLTPIIKDVSNVLVRLDHEPDEDDIKYSVKILKERIAKCKKIAFSSDVYRNNIDKIIQIISNEG